MKEIILKNDEEILFKIRSFVLTNFWPFFLAFLILSLDSFFMFRLFDEGLLGQVVFYSFLLFALFIFFRTYFIWKKNVFIITNKRLIDIEQRSFFEKVVSEIFYNQIDDIFVQSRGFFASIFKYGNLNIQTKKTKFKLIIPKIKNPLKFGQIINSLKEDYVKKESKNMFDGDILEFIQEKINSFEKKDLIKIRKMVKKRLLELED